MQNIDFLPIEYRRKHEKQQTQPWQILTSVAIVGLVTAAMISQHYRWIRVHKELETIAPAYEGAVELQNQLVEYQKRLNHVKSHTELYTYLSHPWPRTQLLSALMRALPEGISFQQVQILRELPSAVSSTGIQPQVDKKAEEERLKALLPSERDLEKLRSQLDPMQTTVIISGTVTDSLVLHRYLSALDAMEIFEKTELDSINSVELGKGGASLQFRVVLGVQPGYGQPGGPKGSEKLKIAKTDTQKINRGGSQP